MEGLSPHMGGSHSHTVHPALAWQSPARLEWQAFQIPISSTFIVCSRSERLVPCELSSSWMVPQPWCIRGWGSKPKPPGQYSSTFICVYNVHGDIATSLIFFNINPFFLFKDLSIYGYCALSIQCSICMHTCRPEEGIRSHYRWL